MYSTVGRHMAPASTDGRHMATASTYAVLAADMWHPPAQMEPSVLTGSLCQLQALLHLYAGRWKLCPHQTICHLPVEIDSDLGFQSILNRISKILGSNLN
jgi:hypothetical protein